MTTTTRLTAFLFALALAGAPLAAAPLNLHSGSAVSTPAAPVGALATVAKLLAAGALVFGAIRIKDTGSLAQKFVQRAGAAQKDYADGVASAGADWETNTKNGESAYEQGVQEAIAKKRFGRGVAAAGQSKYVTNATKLGPQRYQTGVANAQDAWARGVQPALDKLKSITLPPRGPRRSPQNQQRANMVALELGKLKDGQ